MLLIAKCHSGSSEDSQIGSQIAAWMRLSIVSPSSVKKEKLMVDLDGDPGKRKMQEEKKNSILSSSLNEKRLNSKHAKPPDKADGRPGWSPWEIGDSN